jgi:hypothetical protein
VLVWEVRAARPVWTRVGAGAVGFFVLAVVLAMTRAAGGTHGVGWLAVPLVLSLLLAPAVLVGLYLLRRHRNLRLVLAGDTLTHHDVRGRTTAVDVRQVASVFELTVSMRTEQREVTVLVDGAGAVLLALWHGDWERAQRRALWAKTGLTVLTATAQAAAAPARFPGLRLPVSFVHPYRTAMIAVTCVFAYAAAWVTVLVLTL